MTTFAISAAYAGVAGSLSVMVDRVADGTNPVLYFQRSIEFLVAMVIGGAATILGRPSGALLLVLLRRNTEDLIEGKEVLSPAIFGASLIAIVYILPEGVVGGVRRLLARLGRRATAPPTTAGRRRAGHAVEPATAPADPPPGLTQSSPPRQQPTGGHMLRGPSAKVVAALMALALLGSACSSRDDDDASTDSGTEDAAAGESSIDTADCVSDPTEEVGDSIKLVSSYPQSGLTAAFSEIARGWKAYFDKVNAEGGVDFGGKTVTIEYDDADDQYNAAETAANIDEMVGPEGDGAFAVFSVVGTANNLAIRDTLGELCVPNIFAGHGLARLGQPRLPVD